MSHIPSAAMPHAKPHEPAPTIAPAIKGGSVPWAALAAGGVLAIGGAITAAWLLRGRGQRPQPARASTPRRSATAATRKTSTPRKKPTARKSRKTAGSDS